MMWIEAKIYTTTPGVEVLSAELLGLGVSGWQVDDPSEIDAYLADEKSPYDYAAESVRNQAAAEAAVITLYLADDTQGGNCIAALKELLPELKSADSEGALGELRLEVKRRSSEEWEDNWKQYYKPFRIGSRLVVCPSWEEYQPTADDIVMKIEPGGSFGTGQHQTTRLCLELLEELLQERKPAGAKLLDIGCGTGILSVGALLLGAEKAAAVDIEEHSAKAATENAAANGFDAERYQAFCGDILSDDVLLGELGACFGKGGYDIITVNIVADVIIAMSPLFGGLLRSDGRLICSGIIEGRRDEVLAALEKQGFVLRDERCDNGWHALAFNRR